MVHDSWRESVYSAYERLSPRYRRFLEEEGHYFPDKDNYFNAFKTLPKEKIRFILFGQDPYPRRESAIGYAFIDGRVNHLFAQNGLDKAVNKATSLRNFVKMALVARGDLSPRDTSQEAIANLDKSGLIESIGELKENFEKNGVLLLNTALVFSTKEESKMHIREWRPFVEKLLDEMREVNPSLILFGTHARALKRLSGIGGFHSIELEHPYNHTFITNAQALELFGSMDLLAK